MRWKQKRAAAMWVEYSHEIKAKNWECEAIDKHLLLS